MLEFRKSSKPQEFFSYHGEKTAVFIDLDNTVLLNPFETSVFPSVTARISTETGLPAESIKTMILREHERRKNDNINTPSVFDWDDIARTVAKRLGVKYDLSIEYLVNEYARSPYISMLEDADVSIRKLKKPHRLIVAATNGLSKYQLPVLRALGIDSLFDVFLAPDLTNALKGHLDFYGGLLDKVEVAISVGDSYGEDIVGPKKLGMYTVLISRSIEDSKIRRLSPFERVRSCDFMMDRQIYPDAIILHLSELPSVVNKIERKSL
jgi:putative hydrolase of the HAD superfamily